MGGGQPTLTDGRVALLHPTPREAPGPAGAPRVSIPVLRTVVVQNPSPDAHNIDSRFIKMHQRGFGQALREVRLGQKVGHWSWYVFPIPAYERDGQPAGSSMTRRYALVGPDGVDAYLRFPPTRGVNLRANLQVIYDAFALALATVPLQRLLGGGDSVKLLVSCLAFKAASLRTGDVGMESSCERLLKVLALDSDKGVALEPGFDRSRFLRLLQARGDTAVVVRSTPAGESLPKSVAPPDGVLRFFEGHEGPHRYLSNHYVGSTTWRFVLPACCRRGIASARATGVPGWTLSSDVWSAEGAVMLCKAAIMMDLDSYRALQHVRDPDEAKRIGRAVGQRRGTWDDAKWVALRGQVAQSVVDQKFASCPDAASILLDTGDLLLAETNPNDRVWGVGMSSSDPRVGTPSSWPVSPQLCNLLGRCLMVVRSRLRSRRRPAGLGQSATARKHHLPAGPGTYDSYYDGAGSAGVRSGTYIFVSRRFGISVPRGRGLHDQEQWDSVFRGVDQSCCAVRALASAHSITTLPDLDRWLHSHIATTEWQQPFKHRSGNDDAPVVRSVAAERTLDRYLSSRDTRSAGAQSLQRTSSATATVHTVTPYALARDGPLSPSSTLQRGVSLDDARDCASAMRTDFGSLHLYPTLQGADANRDFSDEGLAGRGCTLLRTVDNCIGITMAGQDGALFDDSDYNLARRVWAAEFSQVRLLLGEPRFTRVVLPHHALGTWPATTTSAACGIPTSSRLFKLLMHHLVALLKSATNSRESALLDVSGVGYRHFSLPAPSYVRLLRDAGSAPALASALGVGARLHNEASLASMSAVLSLHSDVRLAWSSRELLRSRDPTLSDTTFGPAQPDRVLRQSPTFTAPLAEGGLKSYQAGPLTAARVSDHDARVLWDSGCTSSYDPHPWILIQPEFAAKHGIVVDATRQFRVAAVDGTRVNTTGTADIVLQFPRQPAVRVEARVMSMESPDEFDLLIGHSFMLQNSISLDNSGVVKGVRFSNGALLEYALPWEQSMSDVTLFRCAGGDVKFGDLGAGHDIQVGRDDRGLRGGHGGSHGSSACLEGLGEVQCNNSPFLPKATTPTPEVVPLRRGRVSEFRLSPTKCNWTDRLTEQRECHRLKEELRDKLGSITEEVAGHNDDPCDFEIAARRAKAPLTGLTHGEVWTAPMSTQVPDDQGRIYEDMVFLDSGGNEGSGYGPEMEGYLRQARDGNLDEGVFPLFWDDQPDEERLLQDPDTHSSSSWTAAAIQVEADLPEPLRIVTRLVRRSRDIFEGPAINHMGFVRKVEASVTPEDRKKHGEWCQHIAPERVMAALTAVCHEKVKILITATDGTSAIETWDVEDVKLDLIDHKKGRILGSATSVDGVFMESRRGIFDDENPSRVVTSEPPFSAELKQEYKDGTKKPWYTYRRVPPALKGVVDEWIRESVRRGIIIPFKSAYSAPIFCVPKGKKDVLASEEEEPTRYRIVCDLRQANAATVEERYPNPSCQETFDCMTADKRVFSSLDLAGAFFQTKVSKDLFPYLAFVTHGVEVEETTIEQTDGTTSHVPAGLYSQWTHTRLPMGASYSPAAFQSFLDKSLTRHCGDVYGTEILSFVDDIAVCTDTHQRHMDVLQSLFTGLAADGWTLASDKTNLFSKSIRFLGLVVSCENDENAAMLYGDSGKVQVVLNLPRPRDVTALRGFLGACNYYRNFICGYSQIADPLVKLTRKGTVINTEWGKEHDEAFEALKQALASSAATTAFDPAREIVIQVDAAACGCGAVLQQVYEGKLRPVAFFSKQYREDGWKFKGVDAPESGPGSNKPPQLLELRAIVETCLHFKRWLDGNVAGIRILSDHSSLTSLRDMAARGLFTPQIQRWTQFLAGLEAKVQWKAGATMHVADFLSRYSHRDSGMKDGSELMADMTTDAGDVTAYDDDYLDRCSYGGADQVLSGLSIKHVIPTRCPESKRVFEGGKIGDFLRVNRACFNTGTCDVGCDVIEAHRLDGDPVTIDDTGGLVSESFVLDVLGDLRRRKGRCEGVTHAKVFKQLWEPEGLSQLRDNMIYEGGSTEGNIQKVLSEGLSDEEAEALGVLHAKEPYGINRRGELEVYDAEFGYAVVVPEARADIFRALVQWHHAYDHPSEDMQFRVLRRRFFWRSVDDMRKVVHGVCDGCPDCQRRKRSTSKPYHTPSPLPTGGRPWSVISVDPKPMDVVDIDTGYDSLLVVTCRFSGYTIAIPHYKTDSAEEIGRLLARHVYDIFGVPELMLSDHDQKFESDVFKAAMLELGCRVELGTPYHGKTSGAVEIRIKGLQDALNMRCHEGQGQHWVAELTKALYSVNSKENPRTGLSPFSILFGYRPTSPLDFLRPSGEFDRTGWDYDGALHDFLSKRGDSRGRRRDNLRQQREVAERRGADSNRSMPDYGVGGWVMLHKRAFGPGGTESKLVSEECVGPFRVKALLDKGRVEVELDRTRYTKHKTNVFSLEHVRKFFQRRPWGHDQISLDEHLSAPWEDDAEFEVDKVVGRRWMHNQYKYSVSYKGRSDDVSKYHKRDDARFASCTGMIDAYDEEFPFGSLRRDEPSAKRRHDDEHKESRRSGRLNNRRLNLGRGPNTHRGTDTRDLGRHNKVARLGRRRELVLRRAGQATLQLFVRTTAGTVPVRASPSETVRGLQQRLEGARGLCKGLRLRYQGKDMDEGATLRTFRLRDFATLDVLGPLRGGMILGISADHTELSPAWLRVSREVLHWQVAWGAVCGWELDNDFAGLRRTLDVPRNPSMVVDQQWIRRRWSRYWVDRRAVACLRGWRWQPTSRALLRLAFCSVTCEGPTTLSDDLVETIVRLFEVVGVPSAAVMDERRRYYEVSTPTKVLSLVSPGDKRRTRYPKLWKPPWGTNTGPGGLAYNREVAFNRCSREFTADRYDTGVFDVANRWARPDSTHPRNQQSVQSFWRRRVLPHLMVSSAGPPERRRKGGIEAIRMELAGQEPFPNWEQWGPGHTDNAVCRQIYEELDQTRPLDHWLSTLVPRLDDDPSNDSARTCSFISRAMVPTFPDWPVGAWPPPGLGHRSRPHLRSFDGREVGGVHDVVVVANSPFSDAQRLNLWIRSRLNVDLATTNRLRRLARVYCPRHLSPADAVSWMNNVMRVGCQYHLTSRLSSMPVAATPPPYSEGVWSDRIVRHTGGEMNFVYQNTYDLDPNNAPPSDDDIQDNLDRAGVELFLQGSQAGYLRMFTWTGATTRQQLDPQHATHMRLYAEPDRERWAMSCGVVPMRRRTHESTCLEARSGEPPSYGSFYKTQHDEMAPRYVDAYGPPGARHERHPQPPPGWDDDCLAPPLRAAVEEWIDRMVATECLEPPPALPVEHACVSTTPAPQRQDYVFIRRRFGLSLTRHRRELTAIIDAVRGTGEDSSSTLGSSLADGDTEYQPWSLSPHARHVYAQFDGEHDPDVWDWLTARTPDHDGEYVVPRALRSLVNQFGCKSLRQLDYLLYSQELVPDWQRQDDQRYPMHVRPFESLKDDCSVWSPPLTGVQRRQYLCNRQKPFGVFFQHVREETYVY
jgi:ribA/ribD-fused uncharacterized protein